MEPFDKASIAGVVAFIQNSTPAIKKKIIADLLKNAHMRRVAKAIIDSYERGEKQADTPETKEGATPSQPKAPISEFSAEEEQQRKREPDWIDPARTKGWFRKR